MNNLNVYWERILTTEGKAVLKQLIGNTGFIVGFSRLHANLYHKGEEHYHAPPLVGQGPGFSIASMVEPGLNKPILHLDFAHAAFLKPRLRSGQETISISHQYFSREFWWQYHPMSSVFIPANLTLSAIALVYMEENTNSYDITTRERLLADMKDLSMTDVVLVADMPATFSHLTENYRLLNYIVLTFEDRFRFFIEFTDNPYGYGLTYGYETNELWNHLVTQINDDTGLKMHAIEEV